MLAHFVDVCCACLPAEELPALAELRALPGIQVLFQEDKVWVRWEGQEGVIERLLPIKGVDLFSWREGQWYRLGASLPAFDVPGEADYRPLHQVLFPAAVQPEPWPDPAKEKPTSVRLALQRDHHPRPTTALLALPEEILAWADSVPSSRLAQLRAAWNGYELLLVGERLPVVASGRRLWGETVLKPLGYRLEPDLAENIVRAALGLQEDQWLLVGGAEAWNESQDGGTCSVEVIPVKELRPLERAGLRRLLREGSR